MRGGVNKAKIGEVYNRLTLIEDTGEKLYGNNIKWLCKCECGNTTYARVADLRNGSKKSCGCLNNEMRIKTHSKNKGEASFNHLQLSYKCTARRKNIEYALNTEDFRTLIAGDCYYCGSPPQLKNVYINSAGSRYRKNSISKEGAQRAWISANGIDRIDSNKGYLKNNCRSCCSICNMMKLDHKEEFFISHINKIISHRKHMNE